MKTSSLSVLVVVLTAGCSAKRADGSPGDAGRVVAPASRPDAGAKAFPKPGAGQAALLARFALGGPDTLAPSFIKGVRFQMSKKELLRARPKARIRPGRAGAFSLSHPSFEKARELPAGLGPVERIDYRLRWGRLTDVRIRTRFTKAWPALVAKAKAKWGKPYRSLRHAWMWRHRDGLVMLRGPVSDSVVTIRIRRRLGRGGPSGRFGGKPPRVLPIGRASKRRRSLQRATPWGAGLEIRRVSSTRYHISQASYRKLISDSATLQRLVRVAPHYRAGRPSGLKLFGIRPRSLFARLGLRNGDVVTHLAGKPTQDPRVVLETLHRLRRLRRFEARLERHGQSIRLQYRVVP